jgi:sugar phosphate isomerase/epimerase
MAGIKGPAVFLAQFLRDTPPFNTLENICKWFADLGYIGVQIPGWDRRVIDIDLAATSATYCDELRAKVAGLGLSVTEVPAYLAGQVLAIHPAYEASFASFHPPGLRGAARTEWAAGEVRKCIDASAKLGLRNVPVLSGGFAWHMIYPWPQRPPGLIDEAFKELARRWRPLLDYARDRGCVIGYELHPGSDIYDGATFEMFLDHTDQHSAACINYDPSHLLLAARLLRIHRTVRRSDQWLSRQGRRVPTERTRRRLWGLPAME